MPQVRTWEANQPGDWFQRGARGDPPLTTVRLPCGHDGNLRGKQFTITIDGGELSVKESIVCPEHPTRWWLRSGRWRS